MIVLRLSLEEARVLEKVLPEVQPLPADETVYLLAVMKALDICIQEHQYEKNSANHD